MYPTGSSFRASQSLLCILIRAWVCPPRPYIEIIPHSAFEAIYITWLYPDTSMGMPASSIWSDDSSSIIEVMYFLVLCRWFGIVVPGFSWFLLFSTPQDKRIWLMMSIGHMMSSCPRTSGGNLLTPKSGSLPHPPHYMAHLSFFLPYLHQKPRTPSKKSPKGLKCLQKAIKPFFLQKISKIPLKKQKSPKRKKKYKIMRRRRKKP